MILGVNFVDDDVLQDWKSKQQRIVTNKDNHGPFVALGSV